MSPAKLDAILNAKSLNLPLAVYEWFLLASRWTQNDANVWIAPQDLVAENGIVDVLHDKHGINAWSLRETDLQHEDPPVVSDNKVASPTFSQFVAAMIINDLLFFDDETGPPVELKRASRNAMDMRPVASCCGDVMADGPLESATIVIYAYPNNGPLFGKARTLEGQTLLSRWRKH